MKKNIVMRKTIIVGVLTFLLMSCGNNTSSNSTTSDSTSVNSAFDSSSSMPGSGTPAAGSTGTTGTGTVSDSGNAANPGSDTTHMHNKMKDTPVKKK